MTSKRMRQQNRLIKIAAKVLGFEPILFFICGLSLLAVGYAVQWRLALFTPELQEAVMTEAKLAILFIVVTYIFSLIIWDLAWVIRFRNAQNIDERIVTGLFGIGENSELLYEAITKKKIRYLKGDFSASACVIGIILPKIIISHGLLIALMKRDPAASSIVAHEYAHILGADRLTLALASGVGLGLLLTPLDVVLSSRLGALEIVLSLAQVFLSILGLMYLFRRREFAADYIASKIVGEDSYRNLLLRAPIERFSIFHPSPKARISAFEGVHVAVKASYFFYYYLLITIFGVVYLAIATSDHLGVVVKYAVVVFALGVIGMCFEKGRFLIENEFILSRPDR